MNVKYLFSTLYSRLMSDAEQMPVEALSREAVFGHNIVDFDRRAQKSVNFATIFDVLKVRSFVELGKVNCFLRARTNCFCSAVLERASGGRLISSAMEALKSKVFAQKGVFYREEVCERFEAKVAEIHQRPSYARPSSYG
jgi:hypothetical protein